MGAAEKKAMASVKVVSLLIKTLSKPIASRIKGQAQDHPAFRSLCVGLAQSLHRYETRLAAGLFNNLSPPIRPLSDAKAIQNGANFLSEAFLFSVALSLIVAENLRSRKNTAQRRDAVNDRLDVIDLTLAQLTQAHNQLQIQLAQLSRSQSLLSSQNHQQGMPSNFPSRPPSLNDDDDLIIKKAEIALGWLKEL